MHNYPEPPFREPLDAVFVYGAWSVDPVSIGPFVRPSNVRRRRIRTICVLAREIEQLSDVDSVRVFEAAFIPPLLGVPNYDVVMLVRTSNDAAAKAVYDKLRDIEPLMIFTATNAARFGDTQCPDERRNILLNHFTGPPDQSAATDAWREISAWYAAKTGVDNSTLLRPEDGPYVIVNYVRIPGAVVPFMLQQVLRPSFHRYVRSLLKQHRLTALPVFVRAQPLGSTNG